jgi:hypothetical protein
LLTVSLLHQAVAAEQNTSGDDSRRAAPRHRACQAQRLGVWAAVGVLNDVGAQGTAGNGPLPLAPTAATWERQLNEVSVVIMLQRCAGRLQRQPSVFNDR